jgi:hypothetical protein
MQAQASGTPASPDRALVDLKELSYLRLSPAVIKSQPYHFAFLGWKLVNCFMETAPQVKLVLGCRRGYCVHDIHVLGVAAIS